MTGGGDCGKRPSAYGCADASSGGLTYIVITPVFNESKYLSVLIDSMAAQNDRPDVWILVDDGSTDNSWNLIQEAVASHAWIRGCRRTEAKGVGDDGLLVASEARAFLDGLKLALEIQPCPAFVVKLDADLKFEASYFRSLLHEFEQDPKLGIAGGTVYEYKGKRLIRELVSRAHVRGATKVYRFRCYQRIGGVRPVFGWDVIDEILARDFGWGVASFDHIHLIHLRRTASRGGRFRGWSRNGHMAYYVGMSPIKILARAAYRLLAAGDVTQASGLIFGYFGGYLTRSPRLPDQEIRRIVRKNEWMTAIGRRTARSLTKVGAGVGR